MHILGLKGKATGLVSVVSIDAREAMLPCVTPLSDGRLWPRPYGARV